ncbi:MAG: NUDIX domain-containing protein [Planctomycetes bacterium]|nr:NUDIX domain-containing protein [Planctomycetota bacterium]
MPRPIQRFEVGIKAFVVRDDKLLLLQESGTKLWELPGGRIDVGEELLPQTAVLARELREELGEDFRVDLGPLAVTWIRNRPPDFVFLVGRLCWHRQGEPRLSQEHAEARWADANGWRALPLAPGYLEGLEEFWRVFPSLAATRRG